MNKAEQAVDKIDWRVRRTEVAVDNAPWFHVRRDHIDLPHGEKARYTYLVHPGAVQVVPLSPEGQVYLIETYRHPIKEWIWAVPGGGVGDKPGCTPEEVARAELAEEMGGAAGSMRYLGTFPLAAGVAQIPLHHFLAQDVTRPVPQQLEATESVRAVELFSFAQVDDLVWRQQIELESAFAVWLARKALAEPADWRPSRPR